MLQPKEAGCNSPLCILMVDCLLLLGHCMPQEIAIPPEKRRRLLVFNLRTDMDDHILGFTTRWLNELALYYEQIDVLTTHKGRLALANNVHVYSTGRERGLGRIQQLIRFYGILLRLLLQHRYDACFAHMQPLFAAMGGFLLSLRGVRTSTWYTHRQMTRQIQLATRFSYRVVSAVPSSFPINTPKLRAIGHGVDTDFFTADYSLKYNPPRIVYVARLTEIKQQDSLLMAAKDLDCEVILVGDIPDGYEDSYKKRLYQLADELEIRHKVIFAGAQTSEQVRDWYRSATIAINLSPIGLFDKATLEAMACAVPTIVSNSAFAPLTGDFQDILHIPAPDDVAALKTQLTALLKLSSEERATMGERLRENVIAQHSLKSLIPKLIFVMHRGEMPIS
jgi:glycosyltransferase involved in cell wall biosynthesis